MPVFGGEVTALDADLVVWHRPRTAVDGLARALGRRDDVSVIGDALTPRRISHAIAEGYKFGAEI